MDNEILVSCIMPTRGRPQFAPQAVKCFLAQTYPHKELLILDDEDEPSFPADWIPPAGVSRVVETIRFNIPQKLNKLCAAARGEVISRFDDDDWSASRRLETQLDRLLNSGCAMTGYHSMVFIDESGNMKKYRGSSNYCLGSSMMFRKSFYGSHRWNERKFIGSDKYFGRAAAEENQLISVDAGDMMYARVHAGNTAPKRMDKWSELQPGEAPSVLGT